MSDPKISQHIELATRKLQSGDLPGAEVLFREILRQEPNNAMALQGVGLVCFWTGVQPPFLSPL